MILEIDLKNKDKADTLLELLKSLDYVERVKVADKLQNPKHEQKDILLSKKHWGSWKQNSLSLEKIDYEIRKMREEWDRDIY